MSKSVVINSTKSKLSQDKKKELRIIKKLMSANKYEEAIKSIEENIKKYPLYSSIAEEFYFLKIEILVTCLFEKNNTIEESKKINKMITDYLDNYAYKEEINKLQDLVYVACCNQLLKLSEDYLSYGNYVTSINFALKSIKYAQRITTETKKQHEVITKSRKLIKSSLKKIGLLNESSRVNIKN